MAGPEESCCSKGPAKLLFRLLRRTRPAEDGQVQPQVPARLLEISLTSLYSFLNLSEALLALRPSSKGICSAATAIPRLLDGPLNFEPEDLDDLLAFFRRDFGAGEGRGRLAANGANPLIVARLGMLLSAAAQVVKGSLPAPGESPRNGAGCLHRLCLPFGLANTTIRSWSRAGLLAELRELHLLGVGGPSDAGLTYLARRCPKLQRLSVLGGGVSAAAALLLRAQSKGAMSKDWWRGFRCTRLCILPRLRSARLKDAAIQRVPAWFCGQWSPMMPTWGHEVHCYDALGRFVCMRNGLVEQLWIDGGHP